MKKYASLILFAFLLNGCDDGDLTVDTIDFESVTTSQACDPDTNTLIYKLKDQEALLLQMPEGSIVNDSVVKTYPIDSKGQGQYRVVYRAYDGKVATANICGTIPPSTPRVTEEWLASDGVISITTTPVRTKNTTDDGDRITGYSSSIVINNITFAKPSGNQTQAKYTFGTYVVTVTPADLTFKTDVNNAAYTCDSTKVYNYNLNFYLSVEALDPTLIVNEVTPTGSPRTKTITETANKVFYRTAKTGTGSYTNENICTTTSTTPVTDQTWTGDLGGTIEVTTTSAGTGTGTTFTHTIVLKNVVLKKGNSSFKLGSNFLLGKITTK